MVELAHGANFIIIGAGVAGYYFGLNAGNVAHFFKKHGVTLANRFAFIQHFGYVGYFPNLLLYHAIQRIITGAMESDGYRAVVSMFIVVLVIVRYVVGNPPEDGPCFKYLLGERAGELFGKQVNVASVFYGRGEGIGARIINSRFCLLCKKATWDE